MTAKADGLVDAAEALREAGLLNSAALERAERLARGRGIPLDRAVVALGLLTEDQVLFVVAEKSGVELVFPSAHGVDRDLVSRFPADLLRRRDALPLLVEDDGAVVAFAELPDPDVVAEFARCAGVDVRPVLASRRRLHAALDQVVGAGCVDAARVSAHDFSGMTAFYRRLASAFGGGADELRFEPIGSEVRVRVRRHGETIDAGAEPVSLAAGIAARARMLADLQAPETREAQAAEFVVRVAGRDVALHLTILPTSSGELIVLRRKVDLDPPATLEGYGLTTAVVERLRALVATRAGVDAGGLAVVAATSRPLANAFVAALLAHVDPPSVIAAVTDDPRHDVPGRLVVAAPADGVAAAVRAVAEARPDVLFVDAADSARGAADAVRAAADGASVVLGLCDPQPQDAVLDLVRRVGRRHAARVLSASIVLEHCRALCRRCSRPDADAGDCAGARLPSGCEACGHTGFDGAVVLAGVVFADDDVRARVVRGDPLVDEEADPLPARLRALVGSGRVSRSDALARARGTDRP